MCVDLIVHPAYSGPRLPMCGTRSAYARHKAHGEPPCDACTEAERVYHRARRRK